MITLVTGNRGKLEEARRLVPLPLEAISLDLPEIQSLDLAEVLRAKAEAAWSALGRPIVVEDTALELAALNGFPGPLVRWMLESIGHEGIARVAQAFGDTRVVARCGIAHFDGARYLYAEGATRGVLVLPPRGSEGFGWDPVFRPEGESATYGELSPARKDEIGHRGRAWRALLELLETQVRKH